MLRIYIERIGWPPESKFMRWWKFNAVGIGGSAVQLIALWLLHHFTPLSDLVATAIAVEIAILHNFIWHENWTWKGMSEETRGRRLFRFHVANGFLSITANVALTAAYTQIFRLPLIAANFLAIVTAALLNYWIASAWVFRVIVIFALLWPHPARAAVVTTKLQEHTVAAWDKYIAAFERVPLASRPLLNAHGEKPVLVDVNSGGGLGGEDVPDGFIHHWSGAVLLVGGKDSDIERVLENYDRYVEIYGPELKLASASKRKDKNYDVQLVMEKIETFGLHFAFDVHSKVDFRRQSGDTLVESRSYSIRESDSGHAPYTDLMPEGNDHGILWRLNSYWRIRQMANGVYAELQVISLSRKPLFGTTGQVKARARDSLSRTLRQTVNAAMVDSH